MMTVFLFVASNLSSVLIGWLLGRTGRNAAVVAAAVEEDSESKEGERRFKLRPRPVQLLGVALVAVSAITALNGVIVSSQQQELVADQREFTSCVTDQFNLLIDALLTRSQAAREATDQQTQVFRTVAEAWRNPTPDSSQRVRDAIEEYIRLRDESSALVRQNPYPEPPRDACRG